MSIAVIFAVLLLVGLLTLVSYVDRVYQEAGRFLSREFQDNIDVFEQNNTCIGRQAATIAVKLHRFGPDRCQMQRCRLPWGCHISWHPINL